MESGLLEALVTTPKREPAETRVVPPKEGFSWGDQDARGRSPEVKHIAEPAEKPRRQTVAPGISTWEAVRASSLSLSAPPTSSSPPHGSSWRPTRTD